MSSCSGLHCAGCAGGVSVPPVAFAAAFGFAWVAENIIAVAAVSAACAVLAVAAVVALMRRQARREAIHAATPLLTARTVHSVPPAGRHAIAPTYILNFYGPDSEHAAARVIQAIPGQAGDTITERE
jgi:hypothetical protein